MLKIVNCQFLRKYEEHIKDRLKLFEFVKTGTTMLKTTHTLTLTLSLVLGEGGWHWRKQFLQEMTSFSIIHRGIDIDRVLNVQSTQSYISSRYLLISCTNLDILHSKQTIVQADNFPRKLLPVKDLLKLIAKLSPSQPANPQLGAGIVLISQLSWTTQHPPTHQPPRIAVLSSSSYPQSQQLASW